MYVDPRQPYSNPAADGEFGFFNEMQLGVDFIPSSSPAR